MYVTAIYIIMINTIFFRSYGNYMAHKPRKSDRYMNIMADGGIPYVSVMVNHIFENVSNIEAFTALYKALTDILPRGITISDVFEVETRDGISLYEEIPLSGSLEVNVKMLELINVQPWMLQYAVRNEKNPSVFYFLLSQSTDDTYRAYPLMDNLFQTFIKRLEQKPDVVTKQRCDKLIEKLLCLGLFSEGDKVFRDFQEYVNSFVVKAIEIIA